ERQVCGTCQHPMYDPETHEPLYVEDEDEGDVSDGVRNRFKFTWDEVRERERLRARVADMAFEVVDSADGRTFELDGDSFVEQLAYYVPQAAALAAADSMEVPRSEGATYRLTRIPCRTADILQRAEEYGRQGVRLHGYGLPVGSKKRMPLLVEQRLLAHH